MRTLLLLAAVLLLPALANAQVKDSLVIRFKSGDSVKIPFDQISYITFRTTADVAPKPEAEPKALVYPNPSESGSTITFTLSKPQLVAIQILNVGGMQVRSFSARLEAGPQQVKWDGLRDDGQPTTSGSYFYRIFTGDNILSGKLTVRR